MSIGSKAVTTTGLRVVADDEVVGPCADHRRDVARCDERVELQAGRVEDGLQRRADRHVVAESREVADGVGARSQERDSGRRCGGLEADREEDDLALGVAAREVECIER